MDTPASRTWPVSVKGVVVDRRDRVLLLRNERREWELPGGRLESGEEPAECVVREIEEETAWQARTGPLLDTWVYEPLPGRHVLIVTYGIHLPDADTAPVLSHEHCEIGLFTRAEVPDLLMPDGYKRSVTAWFDHPARTPEPGGLGSS
ncbi:NUDIX domain-containing protein [Embleya sp. NPDC008237]|uniref:NUDIX hydrolase n=1 Tax=Embleya sp. NPDC008237 TaxID=3363978 RepID=UPI0036ED3C29